jgi:hypothetical protein
MTAMNKIRIGEILFNNGCLTRPQLEQILKRQRRSKKPLGQLAFEMFGVPEKDLWRAWAIQIADFCLHTDLAMEKVQPEALATLTPREAWRYRILPLQFTGKTLTCATAGNYLPEAMAFAQVKLGGNVEFIIADLVQLEHFIMKSYGGAESKPRAGSSNRRPGTRRTNRLAAAG